MIADQCHILDSSVEAGGTGDGSIYSADSSSLPKEDGEHVAPFQMGMAEFRDGSVAVSPSRCFEVTSWTIRCVAPSGRCDQAQFGQAAAPGVQSPQVHGELSGQGHDSFATDFCTRRLGAFAQPCMELSQPLPAGL